MNKTLLLLFALNCWAQTNLSTPVNILPPASGATGGSLRFDDSTTLQFVGLIAPTTLPTIVISSATAANPMVLTFATAPDINAGSVIVISGALGVGCSIMNGPQSVAIAAGTSITISLNGTGCTYTGSSASASSAFWTLPNADATNALCGNANGALAFSCSVINVSNNAGSGIAGTFAASGLSGEAGHFVASGTASYAIFATVSGGTNAEAGFFQSANAGSATVQVENDAGGTGQGSAALFVGSVDVWGSNSSNKLHYDAPTNFLTLSDVSGDSVSMSAASMVITGTTATNSSYGVINSSGYQAYLGFASATVPALFGGTTGSPVAFPLPSNTPTATYVLTGNGPGAATSWQPASGGGVSSVTGATPITSTGGSTPAIGCVTCLVTGGGQTVSGSDNFTAAQTFSGGISSDLIPTLNNIYKLGSRTANYWSELNANNIFAFTNINVQTGSINMNYGTSGPGLEVIDSSGDWIGPNVGTTGTPVTQIYATTIGSSSHPVTNGTFTHVTDSDLATGSTYCVQANSTGLLSSFNNPCVSAPTSWSPWTPTLGGFTTAGTLTYARYQQFGKIVFYTLTFSGVYSSGFITASAPTTVNSTGAPNYYGACAYTTSLVFGCIGSANSIGNITMVPYVALTPGTTYTVVMSGVYETP